MLFYDFTVFILLCQVLETLQDSPPQSELKESCSDEYFNATCSSRGGGGDVILVESAKYGRMRVSRCVSTNIGCSIDALEFIEGQCSGRRQCSVYVSDINLQRMAPCSKEFTSYLETKHICINVASGSKSSCQRDRQILLTGKDVGYIASITSTDPGGLGTSACPWKIEADPGQTIRLSLLSFGTRADGDGSRSAGSDACYEVGEVREKGGAQGGSTVGERPTAFSMCSGRGERESVFFVSTGSDVIIQMKPPEVLKGLGPFIVKYEVRGCRQLKAPAGGYVKVEGYSATVHCNHTKETWFLTCTGSSWLGNAGNCSDKASSVIPGSGVASLVDDNFPYGILLVVAIGVALGVLIGGILLSCVAYYMKRHTRLHGYAEPSEWTKQMLDEMEAYNEAKQLTNNTRYIPDGQHATATTTSSSTPVAATTIVSAAATPSRTMDRTLDFTTSLAHVRGCTCPREEDDDGNYPLNNDCHLVLSTGGACNATSVGNHPSRFLYEIPQFNN